MNSYEKRKQGLIALTKEILVPGLSDLEYAAELIDKTRPINERAAILADRADVTGWHDRLEKRYPQRVDLIDRTYDQERAAEVPRDEAAANRTEALTALTKEFLLAADSGERHFKKARH